MNWIATSFLTLLWSSAVLAQQANPEAITACGENLRIAAYETVFNSSDYFLSDERKRNWCKAYSSWKAKSSNTSGSFLYSDSEGKFSLSKQKAEALSSLECDDSQSTLHISQRAKGAARTINPDAVAAYEACLALAVGGTSMRVESSTSTNLLIGLKSYAANKVRRVDVVTTGKATCAGSLAEVKSATGLVVTPGDELSLTCVREAGDNGKLDEVVVQMEVVGQRAWRHVWPGRGPCGSMGQRSCNGSQPADYPAKFDEEAKDYSATLTAAVRRSALESIAKANVPDACDDSARNLTKERLSKQFHEDWRKVRAIAQRNHSCTKGTGGGKKDCGCVLTVAAPGGFENELLALGGVGNRKRTWRGTQGELCMHKNGKGRDEGSITAVWKLTDTVAAGRASTDMAYVMSQSSCFNGCNAGMKPDNEGLCR